MESMVVKTPSALFFNLGERPKAVHGSRRRMPSTRMGTAAFIRKALNDARNFRAKRKRAEEGKDDEGEDDDEEEAEKKREESRRDLKKEALLELLDGKIPAVFVAHREDDIVTAMRLAAEFGIERYSISQAAEAYLVAERLAEAQVPVLVGPVLQVPGSLETMNVMYENAGLLKKAGVTVTMTSGYEGYVPKTHVILFEVALAAVNGLGREAAMQAVTLDAAKVLGIAETHGSLEPGKVADLVLYDGDPFEYTTHVERVVVGGELAFERPRPE